ncbi:hypothetical protein FUAX_36780 [Fulvitalea axinellae]|uniref:Uncharacterized protein n=1 Tax=Fulvitalea axinellae TaxID=1182444 RepID=A0AAU9DDI2_9BACT|nr:hypothetical protein FUAX_36780 [Fulvitalea axinellae]
MTKVKSLALIVLACLPVCLFAQTEKVKLDYSVFLGDFGTGRWVSDVDNSMLSVRSSGVSVAGKSLKNTGIWAIGSASYLIRHEAGELFVRKSAVDGYVEAVGGNGPKAYRNQGEPQRKIIGALPKALLGNWYTTGPDKSWCFSFGEGQVLSPGGLSSIEKVEYDDGKYAVTMVDPQGNKAGFVCWLSRAEQLMLRKNGEQTWRQFDNIIPNSLYVPNKGGLTSSVRPEDDTKLYILAGRQLNEISVKGNSLYSDRHFKKAISVRDGEAIVGLDMDFPAELIVNAGKDTYRVIVQAGGNMLLDISDADKAKLIGKTSGLSHDADKFSEALDLQLAELSVKTQLGNKVDLSNKATRASLKTLYEKELESMEARLEPSGCISQYRQFAKARIAFAIFGQLGAMDAGLRDDVASVDTFVAATDLDAYTADLMYGRVFRNLLKKRELYPEARKSYKSFYQRIRDKRIRDDLKKRFLSFENLVINTPEGTEISSHQGEEVRKEALTDLVAK